ncbi:hypothetical protein GCM10010524_68410 [Streptomyces mexicanus]
MRSGAKQPRRTAAPIARPESTGPPAGGAVRTTVRGGAPVDPGPHRAGRDGPAFPGRGPSAGSRRRAGRYASGRVALGGSYSVMVAATEKPDGWMAPTWT